MTIRELGDGECSTFAFEKRSQAALGNIKQAYIALACTDIAAWKFDGVNAEDWPYTTETPENN